MNRSCRLGAAIAAAAIIATTVSITQAAANPFAWPGFPLFGYGPRTDDGNTARADLQRRVVDLQTNEAPGTVIVDTPNTYLYFVLPGGKAIRYGIGVGREGFTWSGVKTVERKAEWFMLYAVMAGAVVSLFNVPFFGHLSDKIGRKKMYMTGAALTLLVAFPYFALIQTAVPALVVIAVVVSLIPHDMQYGPQAALIAETFDTRLRYSGAGIGYQLASVFAGGPAPLIAAALAPISIWLVAAYIAGMAVITLIATALLPERTGVDLAEEEEPAREARTGPRMEPSRLRRPVTPG